MHQNSKYIYYTGIVAIVFVVPAFGVGFTLLSFLIVIAIVFSPLMEGITEFLYGSN